MKARRRRPAAFIALTLIAMALVAGFVALGVWQVHRMAWKRDLIAAVTTRVHAAPVAAPRTAADSDAYRRVTATGRFLHDKAVLVQASTVRGGGFWVLTPLVTRTGLTLIVNRGFVPPQGRRAYATPAGPVSITGLLRLSEPRGGFLRANDPATGRWYSRDVAAIAKARHLAAPVAPYFVDADAGHDPLPIGGLTVLTFPDNHLAYALTWFALAAMSVGAYIVAMKHERGTGAQ